EVVEAGAHGVGIDEQDLDSLGEDVLIDPGLAPGGGDLLRVEPGDFGRDRLEKPDKPGRQSGRSGVPQKDQDLLALAEKLSDAGEEPGFLGSPPGCGESFARGDQLLVEEG